MVKTPPTQHPETDPKKLIVQEGPDKGRIADPELARIGAKEEEYQNRKYELIRERGTSLEHIDDLRSPSQAGDDEMNHAVGRRAAVAAGETGPFNPYKIERSASFIDFKIERLDRQAEKRNEDREEDGEKTTQ